MTLAMPYRFADGPGNYPAAANWNDDYDWLSALAYGVKILANGGQEAWAAGTAFTNPANGATLSDSWTLLKSGTSPCTANVGRNNVTVDTGSYSMAVSITGAGSSNSYWAITQSIGAPLTFAQLTVLAGVRVLCTTAGKVRLKVFDGTNSQYSSYHTGDGTWQLLQAKLTVVSNPGQLTITIEVNPSDFTDTIYIDSSYLYVVPAGLSARAASALIFTPLSQLSTVNQTISAGGSPGNIQFNNGNILAGNNQLIWDNTNQRLGLGLTTPQAQFHMKGSQANANSSLVVTGPQSYSDGAAISGVNDANNANKSLEFLASQFAFNIGNVGINTGGTAPAYLLDVNGGARILTQLDIGYNPSAGTQINWHDANGINCLIQNPNDGTTMGARFIGNRISGGYGRTAIDIWPPIPQLSPDVVEITLYGSMDVGVTNYHRINLGWQSFGVPPAYALETESGGAVNGADIVLGYADHTNGYNRESLRLLGYPLTTTATVYGPRGSLILGEKAAKAPTESVADTDPIDILILHPPLLTAEGKADSHALVFSANTQDAGTVKHRANWRLNAKATDEAGTSKLAISQWLDSGAVIEIASITDAGVLSVGSAILAAVNSTFIGLGRNRVINGNMLIDQRNEGAAVTVSSTTNTYGPDRWCGRASAPAVFTLQKLSATPPYGFANYLRVAVTTQNASLGASDYNWLVHGFEGFLLEDFFLATGIKPTVLSFWVRSNLTGQFSGGLVGGSPGSRNLTFIYTINVADTWEYKTIPLVADTGASGYVTVDPGKLITLNLSLGTGTNRELAAGAWSSPGGSGTRASVSGSNQIVNSTSNYLDITGVQWELGAIATVFEYEPISNLLAKCRRYYCKSFPRGTAPAQNAGVAGALSVCNPIANGNPSTYAQFPITMRASPTVTTYNPSAANANWRDVTAGADVAVSVDPATAKSERGLLLATGATVTTINDALAIHYAANADY